MSKKTATNWRHVINLPPFEYCGYINGAIEVSYFDEVIDEYKKFEQLISSRQTMDLRLPNGVYRNVLLLSRPGDPMGFRIEWHLEVWSRMNDGSF